MNPPATSVNPLVPLSYAPLNHAAIPDYTHAQAAAAATASAALSQDRHHEHRAAMTPTGVKKRRAAGVPGSRGVANLTPDQLAKKRANDRDAQRAIRERTRNTIESLEARIRELENQQPYQELQRVIAERDRALAECEQLKRRLGAVAGIVGGSHPSLNELATLTAQQSPLPSTSQHAAAYAPPTPASFEGQSHLLSSELQSPHPISHTTPSSQPSPAGTSYQNEQSLRRWSPTDQPTPVQPLTTIGPIHYDQPNPLPPVQLTPHTSVERHDVSFLLDNTRRQSQATPPSDSLPTFRAASADSLPIWHRLPKTSEPTCTLDIVFKDFHARRRQLLRDGLPAPEALGPYHPSYRMLLNMRTNPTFPEDDHSVSAVLIQIIHKFPDIIGLPEQTAILYCMTCITRWLVCPCRPCYERLPGYARPIPEQWEVSHGAWMEYLPWPSMRRKFLTTSAREIKFEDFFVPFTDTLSLNWNFPPETVFLPPPLGERLGETCEPVLNPMFEAHLRNLENWTLGPSFEKMFPELLDETVGMKT